MDDLAICLANQSISACALALFLFVANRFRKQFSQFSTKCICIDAVRSLQKAPPDHLSFVFVTQLFKQLRLLSVPLQVVFSPITARGDKFVRPSEFFEV